MASGREAQPTRRSQHDAALGGGAGRRVPRGLRAVEIAPGRMRAGLVDFLRRAEASGFSLPAARAQLEPKWKAKRG
jgi:hypothetical protein